MRGSKCIWYESMSSYSDSVVQSTEEMKSKRFYLKVCTSGKICLSVSKSREKTIHIMPTKTYEGQSICNANNLIIQSTGPVPCYAMQRI